MQKRRKWILVLIGLLIVSAALCGRILQEKSPSETEVVSSQKEGQGYTLTVLMLGEPEWPFGPTHCRFDLREGETLIAQHPVSLRNDGGIVSEQNFQIHWNEDGVEILVSAKEQSDTVYRISYDGTLTSSPLP